MSHILAELIENAATFSPPESDVDVYGRHAPTPGVDEVDANEGGYVFTMVDRGIGMTAEDLERSNVRLSSTESFTVAPSRYLGHYVVARLATRHDIAVSLSESPAGGVSASVALPARCSRALTSPSP